MNKLLKLLSLTIVLVLAVGATAQAKNVIATSKTKSVTLKKGDKLYVYLDENGSTGFTWSRDKTPSVVKYISEDFVMPETDVVGAGGQRKYRFKAAKVGEGTLVFKYSKSSSKEVAKTYKLKIKVKN